MDYFMKANSNYKVVEIAGEFMAVPVGAEAVAFNGVIALSEAAAFLLKKMEASRTKHELKGFLLEKYDVEESVAEEDLNKIIATFLELGLINEDSEQ